MKRMWIAAAGTILGVGMTPCAAVARPLTSPFIPLGLAADAPAGFVDFCNRDRAECIAAVKATVPGPAESGAGAYPGSVRPVTTNSPTRGVLRLASWVSPGSAETTGVTSDDLVRGHRSAAFIGTGFTEAVNVNVTFCRDLSTSVVTSASKVFFDRWAAATVDAATAFRFASLPTAVAVPPVPAAVPAVPLGRDDEIALLRLVRKVNSTVNRHVIQATDLATVGVEDRWNRLSGGNHPAGDCEDISIEKRLRLIADGFPPERLFYAVAYKSGMGLHVVLVARMAKGDVVLDSLSPHVLAWNKVHYRWIRVQLPGAPLSWARVGTA